MFSIKLFFQENDLLNFFLVYFRQNYSSDDKKYFVIQNYM